MMTFEIRSKQWQKIVFSIAEYQPPFETGCGFLFNFFPRVFYSDDYKAIQKNMNHLKAQALDVDVAKKNQKGLANAFAKFERTPAKIGEEDAWTQRQSDFKEKSIQVQDNIF